MTRGAMLGVIALLLSIVVVREGHSVAAPPALLAEQAPPTTPRAVAVAREDSLVLHAEAVLAISEFFLEWRRLWMESATLRAPGPSTWADRGLRLPYLHCHRDAEQGARSTSEVGATRTTENFARKYAQFMLVESDYSWFSTCPSWMLSADIPEVQDERRNRDGALVSTLRPAAREARARLLLTLDSIAARQPGSGFLTGQQVRFRLDQGDLEGATVAARDCRAERWWCLALFAYVLDRHEAWPEAEATYKAMHMAMRDSMRESMRESSRDASPQALPADERCAWEDVRDLIAPAERSSYGKVRCADRDALHESLWWLADPLWRVAGNERWVTHQSRRVDIALHSALDGDERYVWFPRRGGDAVARLILRYDWPSYTWWDNQLSDRSHSGYLRVNNSFTVSPYTTFEYALDRVHLLPAWNAVAAPTRACESDWELTREALDGAPDPGWWPAEHMRTSRRLVQLPSGQTALFRRPSQIAVASAHRLRQPLMLRRVNTDTTRFDVMLLASTSANAIDTLAQRTAAGGGTVVLRSLLSERMSRAPSLLAIEAMGVGASTLDARTRFGVQPPPTLNAMKASDVAISDPAIFDAEAMADDRQVPEEALLERMFGSLSLDRNKRRVGVYWETYGLAPQDTVTIAVSVRGDADVSGLRRLGVALNVATDPNRSLTIRWTEPNPQRVTRTLAGRVPVQLRSILLNLAPLTPGPYILRISVERAGAPVVSSERRVVLEP